METVARITNLTRQYKRVTALDDLSLEIPKGTVFGLVGSNGAGKTTLIKHLMGMLRPQSGTVEIFGMDPIADPESVLVRMGYLSEDRDLPGWMRVHELMRYLRAFYPNWDPEFAEHLREQFKLDPQAKLKTLSRGQLAQAGLLGALAHRPDFLVLDEPSSGLDPIVRRDILSAIIRTVADEGRTVLFSSHLLEEVERVADHMAMIYEGKLLLNGPMTDLKEGHPRFVVKFDTPPPTDTLPGVISLQDFNGEWTLLCHGQHEACRAAITQQGGTILEEDTPNLEDIFVAHAGAPVQLSEV
ncbi:MAG: ABC transporter ATP-binding protein [Candidatus Hydrogenedentes bacterium]|nr:ABC transporter ATP-binding protein [Candidatus Hydrogenedentota bacterium]